MSVIEEKRIADDRLERPEPLAQRRTLERSFGLIAGILFIGGAFAGIPSSLLIDPAPPATLYLITVAGVAVGLAAMVIPWDRISPRWAHVAMLVAIVQVGLAVALAGDPFVFYFVFIAIFAAYAFGERNLVVIYLGLIALALVGPILVIPDSTRATAAQSLAAIPAIVLVAVMVVFLRERLEDNRRTTRRFAREALALSVRIGRLPAPEPAPPVVRSIGPRYAHPALRRTAIGTSSILSVIAILGMMAAVGVALPGPIERSFAHVGIEHSEKPSATVQAGRDGGGGPAAEAPAQPDPQAKPTQHANASGPRPSEGGTRNAGGGSSKTDEAPSTLGGGVATSPGAAATEVSPSAASPADPSQPSSGDGGGSQSSAGASSSAAPPAAAPVEPPAPPVVPPVSNHLPHLGHQVQSTIGSLLGQHPHK